MKQEDQEAATIGLLHSK